MKEYNITIKVRNNYLLTLMRRAGCFTAAELSRASGVPQVEIGKLLNMKKSPLVAETRALGKAGSTRAISTGRSGWLMSVQRLAGFFRCLPEDMFPPTHVVEKNTAEMEISEAELREGLLSVAQLPELPYMNMEREEFLHALNGVLESLTPRQERVLRSRFGLGDAKPKNLEEVGRDLGITLERVRQIEARALRKLKHPSRSRHLREFIEPSKGKARFTRAEFS